MRALIALLLSALPAAAWDFSPSPICTLSHAEPQTSVRVTYDHTTKLYAIAVKTAQGWPEAAAFSIHFDGPRPNTISTSRHVITGTTLTVTDRGFGNVLDGLQYNTFATAFTETAAVTVSLDGASGPVMQFRACTLAPVA